MVIKPLYTIPEVAELLCLTAIAVRRMVERRHIASTRIGRRVFITLETLQGMSAVWKSIQQAEHFRSRPAELDEYDDE